MNNEGFQTTHWTMVFRAAAANPVVARPALSDLFERYRHPLYGVARARGLSAEDAADAVQEFFCHLIEGDALSNADQDRGRFRAFLQTAWTRFLVDQYRKQSALKRGGAAVSLSLDSAVLEEVWQKSPVSTNWSSKSNTSHPTFSLDSVFLGQWAHALVEATKQELLAGYAQRGKSALASELLPLLTVSVDQARAESLARGLGMSPTAIKVALHRLRARFGETLRARVSETVDDPADIDDELDALLNAL